MYDKAKQVLVDGASDLVTAHIKSDNMIEIKRLDQKFIITGNDFSVMATSPKQVNGKLVYTTITATDGKIDEADLQFRADKPPEGKKAKLDADGKPELDENGEPVYEDIE